MTEKELNRFNRGNEITKLLDYYTNKLSVIKNNQHLCLTAEIEEEGRDPNRIKIYINDDFNLTRKASIVMIEFIIKELETEFKNL